MQVSTPFAHLVPEDLVANLQYRLRVHEQVLMDPSCKSAFWEACAADPIFYCNAFAYTYDPRQYPLPAKVPFILYPYQKQGLLQILGAIGEHDLLIEKSRDMGASWLCILAFEWLWHFRPGMAFLLVSRTESHVDDRENPKCLFWKIDYLHDNLPPWLMPPGFQKAIHRQKLHLFNPCTHGVISGESTTGEVGRGDRRTAVLLDEFAAVEQGHRVLASTRDVTRSRIFNSTPQGAGNAYYDIRQTGIEKLRFHWSDHPYKSRGLYVTDRHGHLSVLKSDGYPHDYKPLLDGNIRSPWYDNECARASSSREIAQELDIDYRGSDYQYFSASAIQAAIQKFARAPVLIGELGYDKITAEPTNFVERPAGHAHLWCLLSKDGRPPLEHKYVVSADVSAGTGSSNSVLVAYDIVTNEKVLEYANPYIRPEEFAVQAVAFCRWLGGAYLIWEANGPGRQFGAKVIDLGYGWIYYRKREESISQSHVSSYIPGWAATKETKVVLIGDYRSAVERGIIVNRSKIALEETLEYIFDGQGGVSHNRERSKLDPTGARANHGDRVIADALAWRGLSENRVKPKAAPQVTPVGSLAWRREKARAKEMKLTRELTSPNGW